jgi:hypothetical protein
MELPGLLPADDERITGRSLIRAKQDADLDDSAVEEHADGWKLPTNCKRFSR